VAFRLAERDLFPEGIAYDPVTKTFFLSSTYKGKIVAVDARGAPRDFTRERQDGFWSGLGMKVDAGRRMLWVATSAEEELRGIRKEELYRSTLFAYNIDTGKLVGKYELANVPSGHLLNDLVVTREGQVYVTDTQDGSVWTLRPGTGALEKLFPSQTFPGANGIALSSDEKLLFVAHQGIAVVDRMSLAHRDLPRPLDVTLTGVDGLYLHGGCLVAVQTDLFRIARFVLTADLRGVQRGEILEAHNPLFREPTTGVVVGDDFYYIATCQYNSFNPDWSVPPVEKLSDIIVLRARLR
jgi:hypothetical protein